MDRMVDVQNPAYCWFVLALLSSVVAGCRGGSDSVDVVPGQYVMEIHGAVTDSLRGPAHYRIEQEHLAGFELGGRNDPGLSLDLEPLPPVPRTYEVLEEEFFTADRAEGAAGVMGFLTTETARFQAEEGSLTVAYVDGEGIGATFSFRMDGLMPGGRDEASVRVTGRLHAFSAKE